MKSKLILFIFLCLLNIRSIAQISGTLTVCVNSTTVLSDASAGGTWSSGNTSVATVDAATGIVTGVANGTATISYNYSPGGPDLAIVTVNPLPASISGSTAVICLNATRSLSDATSGGTWSSSNAAIASVNTSGTVTGNDGGMATISYALSTGCAVTVALTVAPSPITGIFTVCNGSTSALADATPGGTWSSSYTVAVSVNTTTGVITGAASSGTSTITYKVGSCIATIIATTEPATVSILGSSVVCMGSTSTLSDANTGTWSSSNTADATVAAGPATSTTVTAVALGSVTITYTNSFGCFKIHAVTVEPIPAAISGVTSMCQGAATVHVSDATAGGSWGSTNHSVATIDAAGNITGVSGGTTLITFALSGTNCYTSMVFTVNPLPAAISGTLTLCTGSTTTLTDAVTGGTWTSGAPGVATVGASTGVVTGVSTGTSKITYTNSCGSVTAVVTVSAISAITGTLTVCQGLVTTLSDATGSGTWSSSDGTTAPVDGTGDVSGDAVGTATITYATSATCYATAVVTVLTQPAAITGVSGDGIFCAGSGLALSDATPGGTWSLKYTSSCMSVDGSGNVTSSAPGCNDKIDYTLSDGCYAEVSVEEVPNVDPIAGSSPICVSTPVTFTDPDAGGVWSSGDPSTASVDPSSGLVTALMTGATNITYTVTTDACVMYAIYPVTTDGTCRTVNPSTGITQTTNNENGLTVLPNPNSGSFTIVGTIGTIDNAKEATVEVIDILGKTVYSDVAPIPDNGINKTIILDNSIPGGVYFIRIVCNNSSQSLRVTINR